MSEPYQLNEEQLAAFIEGRLTGDERAAVISQLAASREWRTVLAGVVGTEEEEEGDAVGGARRPFWVNWRTWAMAAGLVIAMASALLVARRTGDSDYVASLVSSFDAAEGVRAARQLERPWSAVRGEGPIIGPIARAARLGVLAVDLELAIQAGDTSSVALSTEIKVLLRDVPASGPLSSLYDLSETAQTQRSRVVQLQQARAATRGIVDQDAFDLAADLEASRIAAILTVRRAGGSVAASAARTIATRSDVPDDVRAIARSYSQAMAANESARLLSALTR